MRILHTSDWHLGKQLFSRKRYEEFDQFLSWLKDTIIDSNVDALIVAGDIFDTGTPNNQAQQQYFDFLFRLQNTRCQHVIIVGGNHDAPTFLRETLGSVSPCYLAPSKSFTLSTALPLAQVHP